MARRCASASARCCPACAFSPRQANDLRIDGRLVEGRGEVDESLITGETMPRSVAPGSLIHAGTVNLSGAMVTEATATDDNTLLADESAPDDGSRAGARPLRAAGRSRRPVLRAGRPHPGRCHVSWLARRRAGLGGRADHCHRRAHHHLPLRAGACSAGGAGGGGQSAVRQGGSAEAPDSRTSSEGRATGMPAPSAPRARAPVPTQTPTPP